MTTTFNPPIRAVTHADLPAMRSVIDATGLFPSDMLDGMIAAYLDGAAPDDLWLVAGGELACAAAYCAPERMTSGTWNLLMIAVDPASQRHGLGAALMRHVEILLAARGERILLVETSGLPEFEGVRRFYRGIGYSEEARIRDFYQAGEDKVIFRKPLAPTSA